MKQTKVYKHEEILNTISHAVGILFGILVFIILLLNNSEKTPYATTSLIVYASAIVILFSASTWYHAVKKETVKRKLRVLDHISIYILIAGTYTPASLITLEDGNGWAIFYTVWGIALVGTVLKLFFTGKFEIVSLLLYLLMGWLIVLDFDNLMAKISPDGLFYLILGGGFYTVGILFYAIRKIPYNHFIWHLFVLGGAIAHFFFIYTLI